MRKNKYYVKMLLINQDFGGHMNSAFHQRKSFFYIIFVMITLAMLSLGGAFLFSIPKISEVCADVETVEEQNYVEHQSTGVVGTERKSVFFYVSVWNNKTNEQNLGGSEKNKKRNLFAKVLTHTMNILYFMNFINNI